MIRQLPSSDRTANYKKDLSRHFRFGICLTARILLTCNLYAQDPQLPPGNLGITNLQDGNAPAPGWYYMQYVQAYQAGKTYNGNATRIAGAPEISSILAMQQIVFISKKNFAGGKIGFTVIVPLAKISATGVNSPAPTINPNPLGDIVAGPLVQWFHKRLFGMDYSSRVEIDLGVPVGAYDRQYAINPGAHAWRVFPHYTFTLSPVKDLSFSMRHHINYYFREISGGKQPGVTYNFNYSAEYAVNKSLFIEFAGYYLDQLQQDAYYGDRSYYQSRYGIANTKEHVFAYGPGIGYVFPTGLFLEFKGMQETAVENRGKGFRTTLVLSYKLDK